MVATKNVCVIGGGVSGLITAKVFKQQGHRVTVLERSAGLGGVWEPSRSYPDIRTQSPKDLYRFTDKAMPASYPEWPSGPQVHAYLVAYAKEHGLDALIRLNTAVLSMDRPADASSGWVLEVQTGTAAAIREHYDFVAVCTGQFSDKHMIAHPGLDDFQARGGLVLHSSEFTDPAIVKGRSVVVLGASKSATDIAVGAVRAGADAVTNVYREAKWRVPYFIGGLINFKRILYVRAQENMFPGWGLSRLSRLKHAIAKPFVWANWRALESLLKLQLKLKRCDMVPNMPIESTIACSTPMETPGYFGMVADGRIRAIKGTFARYEGASIVMTEGQKVPADVVILAVGWKQDVPFLAEPHRKKLVEPDGLYRLYRVIANPDLPDMGFVGFNSSFCSLLTAEMAAHWLVRYADGQLARQPSASEMNENIEMMLHFRRFERPAAKVYGGLCVAPYHFRHFDELLADIGATKRRRSPLLEKFTPPDADEFAAYLASAPQYAVIPA